MKFCIVNQYYIPDKAPTGKYLLDLSVALLRNGHSVTILCSSSHYTKVTNIGSSGQDYSEIRVIRLPTTNFGKQRLLGRIIDYLSFYVCVFFYFLKHVKFDRVVSMTTPPWIGCIVKIALLGSGVKRYNWVMDVYPDAVFSARIISNKFIKWTLGIFTKFEYRGSSAVIVIGNYMKDRVSQYTRKNSIKSIPLWSLYEHSIISEIDIINYRNKMGWNNKFVLLYSGNMGMGHRFSWNSLDCALELMTDSQYLWIFSGGGSRKIEISEFIKTHPLAPIKLTDYVHEDQLLVHLSAADAHLVSLEDGWQGVMVPCKIQTIFLKSENQLFFLGNGQNGARDR